MNDLFWQIWPEVPENDGTPTGGYFATQYRVVGEDIGGTPELSEEPIGYSVFLKSREAAEVFLSNANPPGVIEDRI